MFNSINFNNDIIRQIIWTLHLDLFSWGIVIACVIAFLLVHFYNFAPERLKRKLTPNHVNVFRFLGLMLLLACAHLVRRFDVEKLQETLFYCIVIFVFFYSILLARRWSNYNKYSRVKRLLFMFTICVVVILALWLYNYFVDWLVYKLQNKFLGQ